MSEYKIKEAIERALIKADIAYISAMDLWASDGSPLAKELAHEARARRGALVGLYAQLYTPDEDRMAVINLLHLWRSERKLAEDIEKAKEQS